MKKTTVFFLFLFISLTLAINIYINRWDRTMKSFSNSQMEAIYESTPEQSLGFSSNLYALTNYTGDEVLRLPMVDGLTFVSNVSGQDKIFYTPGLGGNGIEVKSLGHYVRLCYDGEPFYQVGPCGADTVIKFSLHEETIDKNSFLFIVGYYDYQGEVGGLYVNGMIISQRIMVKGGVPFVPRAVKKIDGKTIIKFVTANNANLYALYEQKNNQLILPVDYKSIPNDYWDSQEE